MNTLRAALYCRVSTGNQGTDRQVVELTQFAERAGYEVTGAFTEIVSGAKTSTKDRVERAKVIERVRQRQIDVIRSVNSRAGDAASKTWWTPSMTFKRGARSYWAMLGSVVSANTM